MCIFMYVLCPQNRCRLTGVSTDQWRGQSVQKRLIPFEGGSDCKSNDGRRFAVIE
jgi:hypothetical protein